jgi:chaperonin GroEL
MTFSV